MIQSIIVNVNVIPLTKMNLTLKGKLLHYFKSNPNEWIAGGVLQKMEWKNKDNTIATARTVIREVGRLKQDRLLNVEYRNKHHAFYRIKQEHKKKIYRYELIDGIMKEIRLI